VIAISTSPALAPKNAAIPRSKASPKAAPVTAPANVHEDKKPQPLSLFQHEDVPATVGLVVDHSGSMAARRLQVIEAPQTFVQVSNPQGHEFVVNFSNRVSLGLPDNVAFTNDVNVLLSALSTSMAGGQTALYDALLVAMHHIQKAPDKKALLLISDGGDNASYHKFSDVLRAAQELNVRKVT
jgi:Ca-activated chloride channel family protein